MPGKTFAPFKAFTLDGSDVMVKRLEKIQRKFPNDMDAAILVEAQAILKDSQDNYVPVETEELKESGEIIATKLQKGIFIAPRRSLKLSHRVEVTYGRTGGRDYALAVHEHPSTHSPPTWKGKSASQIKWSKPGTGPKYLERPLRRAQRGMAGRLSVMLSAALKKTPGAFVPGGIQ